MTKKATIAAVSALALSIALLAGTASASTSVNLSTPGSLQAQTLTEPLALTAYGSYPPDYVVGHASCADASWAAVGGGYYYDSAASGAERVDVLSSHWVVNSGVQGWEVRAKFAHDSGSGGVAPRAFTLEVHCIKLG